MSFQAYLDNIQAKTGKSPADFRRLATDKGFAERGKLKLGVKAGAVVAWLKADFGLGHGHAMAVVALLKGKKGDRSPKKPTKT
jgi:Domain of unknown function (DUF4287)